MSKRMNFAAGGFASAALGTLVFACSSTTTQPSPVTGVDAGISGLTAVADAGLVGCATLQAGCFTYDGAYAAPAVTASCSAPGGPAAGATDTHCGGVAPQPVSAASCGVLDAGASAGDDDAASDGAAADDAGAAPTAGACGENSGDYGTTMYGSEGKDDDCKYDVTYTAAPICENDGTYLKVTATYLAQPGVPLTGACTLAELCLNDGHAGPPIDGRPPEGKQTVVEGPPGTYTIGPVIFDQPGKWTVRFHFNELCCDTLDDSPHGHAAFFVNVP